MNRCLLLTVTVEGYTLNICYIYVMHFPDPKKNLRLELKGFFQDQLKGKSLVFHLSCHWIYLFPRTQDDFSPPPEFICVFFSCLGLGIQKLNLQSATWHPGWGVDPSHYSITQFGSHRERLLATPIELGGRGHSATWDTTKSLQFALHLLVAVHQPISWNIWSNVKQLLLSMFRVKSLTSSEKKTSRFHGDDTSKPSIFWRLESTQIEIYVQQLR